MLRLVVALAISAVLLALRLDLAQHLGFGDAEALFVAYGFHPQPAYVDYPGLIGAIARWLEPTPRAVHLATAATSTLLPWAGVLVARALGAPRREALLAYFPLALLPALAIGTFAFTPDLPLTCCWLLALGAGGYALSQPTTSFAGLIASTASGAAAALACLSKPSGWALAACLAAGALGRSERTRFRSIAPWAACGMFAILTAPLLTDWWRRSINLALAPELGFQHVALAVARPVLSVTPPFLLAGALVARDLLQRTGDAPLDRVLRLHLILPLLPLSLLAGCTSSEWDWLTPVYLVLALHLTRMPALRPSLVYTCAATGLGVALLGWCWLRTSLPLTAGQWLGGYDAALDTSNDFYAWGPGKQLLEEAVSDARERTGRTPLVIGPHWSVCAQAEVALGPLVHVGCDSVEHDDYDDWSDPQIWNNAQTLLFITDTRFHREPPPTFYGRNAVAVHRAIVERFGQAVRALSVSEFDREEGTARVEQTAPPDSAAFRR